MSLDPSLFNDPKVDGTNDDDATTGAVTLQHGPASNEYVIFVASGRAVNGVVPGAWYSWQQLQAKIGPGTSPPEPTAPGPITGLELTPGNGSLTANWSAPSNPGSSPITGYVIEHGGVSNAVTGTEATVSGLVNGEATVVSVAAVNSVGTGPAVSGTGTPVGTTPPVTTGPTPAVAPPWGPFTVAFDEEFNEGELNAKVWAADFGGSTQNVSSSNENISVGPNGCALTVSSPTLGAAITTKPNGSAKPGFQVAIPFEVESQATFPGTTKVDDWPGLWMIAVLNGVSWELDYAEGINGGVTATLHVWTNNNQTDTSSEGLALGQLTGEHVYSAILNDDTTVTFYVDKKEIGTQTWPTPVAKGAEFYNLASIGVGNASWNDPEVIPGTMYERYRRIYTPAAA